MLGKQRKHMWKTNGFPSKKKTIYKWWFLFHINGTVFSPQLRDECPTCLGGLCIHAHSIWVLGYTIWYIYISSIIYTIYNKYLIHTHIWRCIYNISIYSHGWGCFLRLTTPKFQDWLDQQLESRKSKLESVELEMFGTSETAVFFQFSWTSRFFRKSPILCQELKIQVTYSFQIIS